MTDKVLQGGVSAYRLQSGEPAFLGRLAVLYRAKDAQSDADVIVKVFREESTEPGAIASFYAELDALRSLDHPNVLPILDSGEDEGRRFLVTPYCEGGNLRKLLAGAQFAPLVSTMPLLRQIAAAIDHAHAHGVIHGDIKPENVLLTPDRRTAFLADFGVARHFAFVERIASNIVEPGAGTSAYLSPEQLSQNKQFASSDTYAFALMAYELLTGRLPFDVAAPPFQQMLARVQGNLLEARKANSLLTDAVSAALMQGLAADPTARPRSATALCELLSPSKKWDVFIAYASSDRAVANAIFEGLSDKWRVFLDHKRLLPGDDWDAALSAAQRDALVTVVLVSQNTEGAYYQREEVAAAIDLARRNPESHRVVPIYIGPSGVQAAPYGLRIKHGLTCAGLADVGDAISQVRNLLVALKAEPGRI